MDSEYIHAYNIVKQRAKDPNKIYLSEIVAQLKPLIIKSYNKTSMEEFTYNWKEKILNNLQQYEIKRNKIDWGDISFGIIHGLIGLNNEETIITSSNPIIPPIVSPSASVSSTSALSASVSSDCIVSASMAPTSIASVFTEPASTALNYPNVHNETETKSHSNSSTNDTKTQLPLSAEDKKKIKTIFENLDEKNMWVLSSSTVVERKMMEFALSCKYEHPVHSMIMDPYDRCWTDVFTRQELDEIRNFNLKSLPLEIEVSMQR